MNRSRRILAVWIAIAVAVALIFVVVLPIFGGRKEISRGEPSKPVKGVDPIMLELIQYGALASSSHNAQMWKVKVVTDRELVVLMDQSHLLPQVDPNNREALISLGTFVENVVAAAPARHLRANVAVLSRQASATGDEIVRITFTKAIGNPEDLTAHIRERHTIRTPFLKDELKPGDVSALTGLASAVRYFPLSSAQGKYIQTSIVDAIRQQTYDDKKQAELAGYMRFSKGEARDKRDGITPAMMGLSGIRKWFVETFFTRKTVMSESFRKQTISTARAQAENCAGYFVLTSPDDSVEALIGAGRLLERFWLKATALKVAVHPMSAPLEEAPWKDEIGRRLGLDGKVQMVLRVGYVKDYGHPVSGRREVPIISGR